MWASFTIVRDPAVQASPPMPLVQRNHEIQVTGAAISSYFACSPWRGGCSSSVHSTTVRFEGVATDPNLHLLAIVAGRAKDVTVYRQSRKSLPYWHPANFADAICVLQS
jgi:hypothetical protein